MLIMTMNSGKKTTDSIETPCQDTMYSITGAPDPPHGKGQIFKEIGCCNVTYRENVALWSGTVDTCG